VGGASTAIVLTVKEIGGLSIPIYQDNDSTINIAIDNGTCTGITPAATSANTTQGVATSGCVIYDGDGKDFEGIAIPTITNLKGMILEGVSGVVAYATESYGTMGLIDPAEIPTLTANSLLFDELTFSSSGPSEIRITVIGETA
jgi:hypothetical protein